MKRTLCAILAASFLLGAPRPGAAEGVRWCAPVAPDLAAAGWETLTFDGKRPNRFAGTPEGTLEVAGDGTVSFLFAPVPADAGANAQVLRWSWRAEAAAPPTDLAAKGGDDRTLALYVAFAWDPGAATFGEMLRRPLVEMLQGPDAPGRILAYTWGGTQPRGARFESPYAAGSSEVVVLRTASAETGRWHSEEVAPQADYVRAFGGSAPPVTQIAVVSDSDDTGSEVRAAVKDVCLGPG
ncbi:DUF3047 domain-containing protein [Futiania mangrovi]|uniref:DUF3047 domain-containing protein n=1 Tax=Futiania mangrovi TaxID=2959716 RepID=A0A9J6PBQ9_9PROT|nr:DUF3047 domain-containing protein [Futiania mangrovii]MCP1335945.1 DUF3047 domain-containing protein [Futiania mangrovii]